MMAMEVNAQRKRNFWRSFPSLHSCLLNPATDDESRCLGMGQDSFQNLQQSQKYNVPPDIVVNAQNNIMDLKAGF